MRPTWSLLIFLFIASAVYADTETRATVGVDQTTLWTSTFGQSRSLGWHSGEFNVIIEKHTPKGLITGWSIGFRKDKMIYYEGTYMTFRVEHRLRRHFMDITPRLGLIYGMPGTHLDWTWERRTPTSQLDYTHLFIVRNVPFPFTEAKRSGILYPEASVGFSRRYKRLSIEPVLRFQFFKFGVSKSDFTESQYEEKWVITPSIGINIGFRMFPVHAKP